MGNSQLSASEFAQAESPLTRIVEDVFVIILRRLSLKDFVSLFSTCKLFFDHRLRPNNYFWAQFCKPIAHSINQLLKTVQNGRQFKMNGRIIALNIPISNDDKTMIKQFNFRAEIQSYYLQIVLLTRLWGYLHLKPDFGLATAITCKLMPVSTPWPQPWPNPNKNRQTYASDFYYLVDFQANPTAMLQYLRNDVLPDSMGGRQVVYNNSPNPPRIQNYFSRRGPAYTQSRLYNPMAAFPFLHQVPSLPGYPPSHNLTNSSRPPYAVPAFLGTPSPRPNSASMPKDLKFVSYSPPHLNRLPSYPNKVHVPGAGPKKAPIRTSVANANYPSAQPRPEKVNGSTNRYQPYPPRPHGYGPSPKKSAPPDSGF